MALDQKGVYCSVIVCHFSGVFLLFFLVGDSGRKEESEFWIFFVLTDKQYAERRKR